MNPESEQVKPQETRRSFLRRAVQTGIGLSSLGVFTAGYGVWEASQIRLRRAVVGIPHLPAAFMGKTIAVMADIHHGPYVSIGFVREAVRLTNSLSPDIIALPGDFAYMSFTSL